MIIDSSAIVAILLQEAKHEWLLEKLNTATAIGIGAPTAVETGIVLTARLGPLGKSLLARFIQESELTIIPFEHKHWPIAVDAFSRYGKGRHPAGLNFGNCLTYAVAKVSAQPLLYVGDDFSKTDLPLVGK